MVYRKFFRRARGALMIRVLVVLIALSAATMIYLKKQPWICFKEDVIANPAKNVDKKRLLLTVGVLSQLSKYERRMAIRETWFNVCKENVDKVDCVFFTDSVEKNATYERDKFGDLVHMPFKGSVNFSIWLLWMFKYFTQRYEFDFFLRVDDDYFVCLDRLLKELPDTPNSDLWWGWIHCRPRRVRVDEGFMILTSDIITEVLARQNTTLLCHPFGDQAVAIWLNNRKREIGKATTYFMDNDRLMHHVGNKYDHLGNGLCERYIGLHQAYPDSMYLYWKLMRNDELYAKESGKQTTFELSPMGNCRLGKKLDWRVFANKYRFEPKPCRDQSHQSADDFSGRENNETMKMMNL